MSNHFQEILIFIIKFFADPPDSLELSPILIGSVLTVFILSFFIFFKICIASLLKNCKEQQQQDIKITQQSLILCSSNNGSSNKEDAIKVSYLFIFFLSSFFYYFHFIATLSFPLKVHPKCVRLILFLFLHHTHTHTRVSVYSFCCYDKNNNKKDRKKSGTTTHKDPFDKFVFDMFYGISLFCR